MENINLLFGDIRFANESGMKTQQTFLAGRDPNTILLPRFWALGWIRP